ncbi:MAG TPA: hypothetical protein VHO70_02175 [Chitinispirillaceae bacterium]|nr:hypothetical protein [Chitinispirillaceae bacterium]
MNSPQAFPYDIDQLPIDQLRPFDDLTDSSSESTLPESAVFLPLLVCRKSGDNGAYIIVDGYKRFIRLKERSESKVACVVVQTTNLPEAGKMRIELNCTRPIPFLEKFLFLKWAKSHCSDIDYQTIARQLSIFGKDLRDFEQLSQSSSSIINAVAKGVLDSTLIAELQFLSNDDVAAIISFFSNFTFTRQMQRELLEWLPELVYKNKKSIPELFAMDIIRNIINDRKLNDPQKIKKIRDYFYDLRFPTLSEARKEWQALASAVNPSPSKISFNPSEAFEKNTLEVKIRINDATEARTILKKLSEISEENWGSLIYPALLFGAKPTKKG